jgi:germination protein M
MSRRAATGITRVFPALLAAGAVFVAAALLAACGVTSGGSPTPSTTASAGPSQSAGGSPATSPSAPGTSAQSLYFLRDGKLGVAERSVAPSTMPATAAVKALLAGPIAAERTAGLSSAIPADTRLKSLVVTGGLASVDLSQAPDASASAGAETAAMPGTAELVYTLTRFSTVSGVRILINGHQWLTASSATPPPVTYHRSTFRGFEPPIFVESPGVGGVLPDPFVLRGTASVFEGSFTAQLTDDSGRRVVRVTVQASRGAPGRGAFRQTVVYSTSATHGTLTVYSESMEDGSRQNAVTIPVTLTP